MISGFGRSVGEGIGYPLQCAWALLVAQLVKNLPVIWEAWVQSLGWEDPLEKGKTTHSQYSSLENSMHSIVHRAAKSQTQLRDFPFRFQILSSRIVTPAVQRMRAKSLLLCLTLCDPMNHSQAGHSCFQKEKKWGAMGLPDSCSLFPLFPLLTILIPTGMSLSRNNSSKGVQVSMGSSRR